MRLIAGLCIALALASQPGAAAGRRALHGRLPCAQTAIAGRALPTGPAQYQSGSLTLANGAVLRLQGTAGDLYQVRQMALGDRVAACYGPLKTYGDAGPARTITVLDLVNGAYYATLIGTWEQRSR